MEGIVVTFHIFPLVRLRPRTAESGLGLIADPVASSLPPRPL